MDKFRFLIISILLLSFTSSFAGNQKEEDLKDEVRLLMSQSVADNEPKFSSFETKEEEDKWIVKYSNHLSNYLDDKDEIVLLLKTIHYEATRAGLDPLLVMGIIQIESRFNKYAISSVGAMGYMQVMPFWQKSIGDKQQNLFFLRTNLRYGCTILRHYLELEKGNLFLALGRYNGSRGQGKYPNAVFSAMKQLNK
jgi:soluble lytic murein transglycosylase-like protein